MNQWSPTQHTVRHVEPRKNLRTRVAYRVRIPGKRGRFSTLVLCERHLDALRAKTAGVTYTGDTFAVKLCDHCHPEAS